MNESFNDNTEKYCDLHTVPRRKCGCSWSGACGSMSAVRRVQTTSGVSGPEGSTVQPDATDINVMGRTTDTEDNSDATDESQIVSGSKMFDINWDSRGFGRLNEEGRRDLYTVGFEAIIETTTEWLQPGLIPIGDPVVLIGDEGIGKGLWWTYLIALVTTRPEPVNVLLIVAEDDLARTVKPRLIAAGADESHVHAIVVDPQNLTGVPMFPTHSAVVTEAVLAHDAKLVIVDPWISTVERNLQVKDPQQARRALDPITKIARNTGAAFLLVAHTNRNGGSLRDRYGATSVLRQVARVAIVAAEDPKDETMLFVGIDKTNITSRGNASKFHKQGTDARWSLQLIEEDVGMPISNVVASFDASKDGRTSSNWPEVLGAALANGGEVRRAEIKEIYAKGLTEEVEISRANESASRAIRRWTRGTPARLVASPDPNTLVVSTNEITQPTF